MQDETLEERVARLSRAQGETLEQRVARLSSAPTVKPPLWDRIKATGRAIADDPMGAAKSIGKGLVQNVGDAAALAGGDPAALARLVGDEIADRGIEGAGKRLTARGVGAASLMIPAARVGGAATSALVNAGANAGLGAAQTPDDPMLGAVLGAGVPLAGKLAGKVTGATARAARARLTPDIDLGGVTDDLTRGMDDVQRNAIPKRRTSTTLKETVALDDIGGVESVNKILAERTPRQLAGLDASVVPPRANPLAPAADTPIPETFLAELDGPRREVVIGTDKTGAKTVVIDPEVKADRVAGERLDVAEQRAAERQFTKEVKEIDKAKAAAEAQAIKDADAVTPIEGLINKKSEESARLRATVDAFENHPLHGMMEEGSTGRTAGDDYIDTSLSKREQNRLYGKLTEEQLGALDDAGLTVEQWKEMGAAARKARKQLEGREATLAKMKGELPAPPKAAGEWIDGEWVENPKAGDTSFDFSDDLPVKPSLAETARGMLGRANTEFGKNTRAKNAARAALMRRRGVQVEPSVADTPVTTPVSQAIPEAPPAVDIPAQGIVEPPVGASVGGEPPRITPVDLPPAPEPFVNWRTLGVDPAKPDALNMSASARIQAAASRPDMVERLAAERGRTTFAAMNAEAQKSWAIRQLGIDPLAVDSKKLTGLSGAQIHALKAPLLENAGLMEGIAREMMDLDGDDLVKAAEVFERLERSNDELLATIQREGSARGRDLGALRQMANMTTDPAVWLIKAKKALGDQPMTASIQARIMRLAKEAAEACGGA